MNLIFFLSILAALLGLLVTFLALTGGLYAYRIGNKSIEVVLFKFWTALDIPFDDIESIRKVRRSELKPDLQTMRIGNSLSSQKVLIKRHSGRIKKIVLTPPDAEDFLKQVYQALMSLI